MTHWLEMIDGSRYELRSSNRDFSLAVEHLAHQLSQINRFNGATRVPYSVAQHSVFVSRLLDADPTWALYGLLHDAHEVVVSDIPRPVKEHLEFCGEGRVLKRLVQEADKRIFREFGLATAIPWEISSAVAHVDCVALATERRDLMVGTHPWQALPPPHPDTIIPLDPVSAARAFVARYRDLAARREGVSDATAQAAVVAEADA